jgi:hypothetical protein
LKYHIAKDKFLITPLLTELKIKGKLELLSDWTFNIIIPSKYVCGNVFKIQIIVSEACTAYNLE